MKKVFKLKVENKTIERQADSIRAEVKKYLKRERNKKVPEKFDHWAFDCKIGESVDRNHNIKAENISKGIENFVKAKADEFYLEIMARAENKPNKPKPTLEEAKKS
jgi:hypothetical protein